MRIKSAFTLLLAMTCMSLGCLSTPQTRYYTLDMNSSEHSETTVNIHIDRIRVAEPLARKEVLIKKSPTEIEYYVQDQWAANVSELVQEKLDEEFGLPQEGRQCVVLSGMVLAFEQKDIDGGAVGHVKLLMEFYKDRRDGEPLLKKTYNKALPAASNNASGVVQAISECLEALAVNIAADAATL